MPNQIVPIQRAVSRHQWSDGDLQSALWLRWGFRPPAILEKMMIKQGV